MKCSVRPMEEGDIDALLFLAANIPEAPHWSRTDYEHCIGKDKDTGLCRIGYIAESEGGLSGFAIAKLVAGVCELESIAVVEEIRGQGIGISLMKSIANWAQSMGGIRLELEVRASNTRAIRFYERFGMRREGLRRGYYHSPGEDAVLMGMPLIPSGKIG